MQKSMNIQHRIEAFSKLGDIFRAYANGELNNTHPALFKKFEAAVNKAAALNGWFPPINIKHSIMSIGKMLKISHLNEWVERYAAGHQLNSIKTVGVIMAGNIPAVGFHDLLCVLISGHNILIKPSSDDHVMIELISDLLLKIEPDFSKQIRFAEDKLNGFDAVIATGSNNSSRYFEYYFGKYPNIIRKNMNGVAMLNGNESDEDLRELAEDVFRYFGLGCRNVSAILVPDDYDLEKITAGFQSWEYIADNNKYHNNYVYNKTLSLLNNDTFYDGGFYIMKVSEGIPTPLSVISIISYDKHQDGRSLIESHLHEIQCVATNDKNIPKAVNFGQTQCPELWDYADDVDTMRFLLSLK